MSAPDMTDSVAVCLECRDWQIDAPRRARASLGLDGLMVAIAQAAADHQRDDHPETTDEPTTFAGRRLTMGNGRPATGGLVGYPLPRWWDWTIVSGAR